MKTRYENNYYWSQKQKKTNTPQRHVLYMVYMKKKITDQHISDRR